MREHRVRRGETCGQIARRAYGNSRRYDLIHEANPELGPMPHHLRAGQTLRLPVVEVDAGADATVTATRREVQHQRPNEPDFHRSRVGQDLDQGWRLSTGERSGAELAFRHSAVASVRASTLVIIYGGGARRVRREGNRAVLRRGSMLSRLSGLSGREPLEVETPSALATLREGESQVDVDESGETRVSVHDGQAATVTTPEGGGAVQVRPGMGTTVTPGSPPRRPRPLPRAPRWEPGPRDFVGLLRHGGTVRGRWAAAPNALRYRVEIARRRDGRELVIATDVPATVHELEFHRLPPGTYYARVSTIDADNFEGRPGRPVELRVVAADLVVPGTSTPQTAREDGVLGLDELDGWLDGMGASEIDFEANDSVAPRVPQYAGLRFHDGVRCRMGEGGDPVTELRLVDTGPFAVTCFREEEPIGGLALEVVATAARLLDADGQTVEELARATTAVRIELTPPLDDVRGLTVLAPDGVTVSEVTSHPDGGLQAHITAGEGSPARAVLQIVTADASRLPLAEAQVGIEPAVADAPVEPPPSVEPDAAASDPHGLPEAFGLSAFPGFVGLRDERRSGSGMHLAMTTVAMADGESDAQLRLTGGARAELLDGLLRLDVAVPLDLVSSGQPVTRVGARGGSRDAYFAASSRVLNQDGLGLALEAGVWTPTAGAEGLDRARLMLAADFSYRFLDDRLAVRTRQAGIFDLVDDPALLWASAYGFDVWIAGPLSAGAEFDLLVGTDDMGSVAAAAVGGGMALDFGAVALSASGRFGLFGNRYGPGSVSLALRGNFR